MGGDIEGDRGYYYMDVESMEKKLEKETAIVYYIGVVEREREGGGGERREREKGGREGE